MINVMFPEADYVVCWEPHAILSSEFCGFEIKSHLIGEEYTGSGTWKGAIICLGFNGMNLGLKLRETVKRSTTDMRTSEYRSTSPSESFPGGCFGDDRSFKCLLLLSVDRVGKGLVHEPRCWIFWAYKYPPSFAIHMIGGAFKNIV